MREHWREFKESEPGYRFKDRYHRLRQSGRGKFSPLVIFYVIGGIALILAGLIMVVAPGPGWVTMFVGLVLIAGESLLLSRLLDWSEVKSRKLAYRGGNAWTRSSLAVKVLTILFILACAAALGYGAYYLFFGGPNSFFARWSKG